MSDALAVLEEIGGDVDYEELRYQLDRRKLSVDDHELEDLIDRGLIERDGFTLTAIVPKRRDRRGRAGDPGVGFTDEELLDRVKLWMLITGKPPTKAGWTPSKIERLVEPLRARMQAWYDIQALHADGDWPSETTIRDRFGSLNAALVLAGYEPRSAGRQPLNGMPIEPAPKKWGPEVLDRLTDRVAKARERNSRRELEDALTELAIAAFTEADRMERGVGT